MEGRQGLLITTDIPTMQLIKFLDKQHDGLYIIKELDDTHIFIHKTFLTIIEDEMLKRQEETHFER
jgi:hypothetical protein